MTQKDSLARRQEIYQLYLEGKSYKEIAQIFNFSLSNARKLVKSYERRMKWSGEARPVDSRLEQARLEGRISLRLYNIVTHAIGDSSLEDFLRQVINEEIKVRYLGPKRVEMLKQVFIENQPQSPTTLEISLRPELMRMLKQAAAKQGLAITELITQTLERVFKEA